MAAQQPAAQQVDFSGHFVGSAFAVGDHAVANTYNGTVIQRFAPGTMPRPLPRGRPQRRPPRDPVDLLGRGAQLMQVDAALGDAGGAIAFHAPAGAGKTVLLKHVALGTGHAWPDGVVYLRVGGQAPEDVLQWLFTVFWDTGEVVYAPGPAQVGEYLRDIRALVVLDDADLGVPAVEQLLNAAHSCGFVLGAAEPVLAGGAHRLGGLDADAARRLFARVLGREPAEDGRAAVDALIAGVEGLPGYVVTAAELVRDGLCSAADLIDAPRAVLVRRRVQALPAAQRELLALLAELAPAP